MGGRSSDEETDANKCQKLDNNEPVFNVKVQNRFNVLGEQSDSGNPNNMDTNSATNQTVTDKQKVKVPPIVLTGLLENYADTIQGIKKFLKGEVKTQYTKYGLKVFTDNINDYNSLLAALQKQNAPYYSYALPHDKPKQKVLKGLPPNIETTSIQQELESLGLKCTKVALMKQKKDPPYLTPIILVTFESTTNLNEVEKVKYIQLVKIYWERYRRSKGATVPQMSTVWPWI